MRSLVLVSLVATLTACATSVETAGGGSSPGSSSSSSVSTSTSTSSSSSSSGGGPSDVNGSVVYTYHAEASTTVQPADLTGEQVVAYVQQGGGWTTIAGSGHADGTFTVPAVPAGMFMLDVAGTYVYTSARQLDLGEDVGGRANAAQGIPGTQIAGAIDGLSPWQPSDTVEWYSANAGGEAYAFDGPTPMAGSTSLNDEPSTWYGALNDGALGDVLYVTQLVSQEVGGVELESVGRFASFPGLKQQDGFVTTVMGSFADVTADQSIEVDLRASEFAAHRAEVSPGGMGFGATYQLSTGPGASDVGLIGFAADLILAYPGESDAMLGTVPFGNPFPSAWGAVVYAGETWSVDYDVPGAMEPASQYGSIYVSLPAAEAGGAPLAPVVTPVRSPEIDGESAFGPIAGVSPTPTVSWTPPALGAPTCHRVTVYQLQVSDDLGTLTYVASLTAGGAVTSMPLPPGLLEMGSTYVLVITAIVSPIDASTAPFRTSPTFASADALTSAFQL